MTPEMIALGRRAVACSRFRWQPGMKLLGSDETYRLTYMSGDCEAFLKILHPAGTDIAPGWGWPSPDSGWLPDLTDAATRGCLLELVGRALLDVVA